MTEARDQAWEIGVPWEVGVRDPVTGKSGTRVFGALGYETAWFKARLWEARRTP